MAGWRLGDRAWACRGMDWRLTGGGWACRDARRLPAGTQKVCRIAALARGGDRCCQGSGWEWPTALPCVCRVVAGAAYAPILHVQAGGGAAYATILHVQGGAPWGSQREVARG